MKSCFIKWIPACIAITCIFSGVNRVNAGNIVGGSSLVSASDELQLEAWLGQGSLTLTKIFDHAIGDGKTSIDFHSAADGKGATFSVIEVLEANGFVHQIIGGYNPQSWEIIENYHYVFDDADRTAFLFNLTNNEMFSEKLGAAEGILQTVNASYHGPSFGGGHDIYVDSTLTSGYAYQYSYGDPNTYNDGKLTGQPYAPGLSYGAIEVFSISSTAVPEPSSFALLGLGGIGLAITAYRRRREAMTA